MKNQVLETLRKEKASRLSGGLTTDLNLNIIEGLENILSTKTF